jgi:2-methylcitrate dehydratase
MDQYEKRFVDYVSWLSYESLTKGAVQSAKERLLDSFACAFAAYDTPAGVAMRKFAGMASASPGASVLGTNHKAPVYDATLACGTLIRALDWNDTYLSKEPAHPSDNIGATLCVADAENKSGKDWILATVLAYEFQCQLCDAAAIRKKGWDHVTYASVSSAAGAAKLLGLNKEQTRDAIAIAVTTGNYLRQTRIGDISHWKASAFAQGARNAVEAALYVRSGMTGPYEIISGQHGLIAQITKGEFDLAASFGGQDGKKFKIEDTYIKYFPAEYHSQSAIWAALDLRKDVKISDIDSILIETSHHSYQIIGMEKEKWRPKTKETADHSLPYITAAALIDGELTLKQFDKEHLSDEKLLALVQKVTVREKKEHTDLYGTSFPNKVTITLKGGAKFEKEVLDPKGHPRNPLTQKEIEAKFNAATEKMLPEANKKKLIENIWNLEKVESMRDIMQLLIVGR